MKKIAMLNCLKANPVCPGAACLRAFYAREAGFARYAGEDLQLTAFSRCNDCGKTPQEDNEMRMKLEYIMNIGTEAVHIGVCAQMNNVRCPTMEANAKWLEEHGIEVIWQTH